MIFRSRNLKYGSQNLGSDSVGPIGGSTFLKNTFLLPKIRKAFTIMFKSNTFEFSPE